MLLLVLCTVSPSTHCLPAESASSMTGQMFPTAHALASSTNGDALQETELKSSFDLEAVLKRHAGNAAASVNS